MSASDFITAFHKQIEAGDLIEDPYQLEALDLFSDLMTKLVDHQNRSYLSRFLSGRQPISTGIYLYGGVGRGKSFLMDLFYQYVPVQQKHRTHFHLFMRDVHDALLVLRQEGTIKDPLAHVSQRMAKQYQLLCLDEFYVADIADAMLLKGLFEQLMSKGVWVVITSNTPPADLYKDGLQRESFLPFIDFIQERLVVYNMDDTQDYRLLSSSLNASYFTPLGNESSESLKKVFAHLNPTQKPKAHSLTVKGRSLCIPMATDNSVWFDFYDLCDHALGAEDYFEITQMYEHVFLENIPLLTKERYDQAKRFMKLIDVLYDQGTQFYCTAEALPCSLFPNKPQEFNRTESRLEEFRTKGL